MSKLIIFILSPLLLIYPRYDNIFSSGYDDAIQFIKDNKKIINHVLDESDEDKTISLSIVFPEIVRYSYLIDFFQKSAMETIYIKHGKEKANFSIGRFQMKPSFVEELEQYIQKHPDLKKQYKYILNYPSSDIKDQRKVRIKRLNSIQWQLNYLKCFYSIMEHRFNDLTWNNTTEKIEFYATAYNHDFTCSKEEIKLWMNKKTFPYGVNSNAKQYAYSKISVYFYKKHWPSLKNDMANGNISEAESENNVVTK